MDEPDAWRWYHHAILVICTAAFAVAWSVWLRPGDPVAGAVLALCAVVLVAVLIVYQVRMRRRMRG